MQVYVVLSLSFNQLKSALLDTGIWLSSVSSLLFASSKKVIVYLKENHSLYSLDLNLSVVGLTTDWS